MNRNTLRLHVKAAAFAGPLKAWDAVRNAACCRGEKRILITRHAAKSAHVHRDFFAWVRTNVPELAARIEFHRLPCRIRDWSRYSLHVSWAGDTFLYWDRHGLTSALRLQTDCRLHHIPVINPVTKLPLTQKSQCADKLAALGIRTPRMRRIENVAEFRRTAGGLRFPLLIREDRGHGRPATMLSDRDTLQSADLSGLSEPIASEFIETRSPRDGLYRKYRYLSVGSAGQPRHMIVNDHWEVRPNRRVMNEALRREELQYLAQPDPNEEVLQEARRALGLDVIGFDYSYDLEGRMVVWEANPFPDLGYPKNPLSRHIFPTVQANFRLLAAYYVFLAKLPVPSLLRDEVEAFAADLPAGAHSGSACLAAT